MSKLQGKVALVTGASKGIGAGIARALAAAGAAVVVNYATAEADAERIVGEIERGGGKAIAVKGDVAKAGDVRRLLRETKEAFGRIDVLVNNAGVYQFQPLAQVTEEEFHRQFNINVLGLIQTTREAVSHFGPDGGSVINIGSAITSNPMPGGVVYAATKGAVDVVTRVLARELGPQKVRVNSINPGATDTEGVRDFGLIDSDVGKQVVANTPLGRIGVPSDIAPAAVFLASDDSAWLTGEILLLSGGYR